MCDSECLKIKDRADLGSFVESATRVADLLKGASQLVVFKHMYLDSDEVKTQLPVPGWPDSTHRDHIAEGFFHGAHYGYADGEEIFEDWPTLAPWRRGT